jgi:hypothetical protein
LIDRFNLTTEDSDIEFPDEQEMMPAETLMAASRRLKM